MKKPYIIVAFSIIVLVVLFVLNFTSNSTEEHGNLFAEELQRAGVERVGQPIEGFAASIYLEAFPGFTEEDFDGVETFEGITKFINGKLGYERIAGNPITSAEQTISNTGYQTLLTNFSKRVAVAVKTEADIAALLEKLREGDEIKASYTHDDFSIWIPEGWYPYENGPGVFFVRDKNLNIPQQTDGFALGPYIQVGVHTATTEEIFAQNLWKEGSEFLVSKEEVRIGNNVAIRVVTKAAGAAGEVLHYVFQSTDGRTFLLSHYPFEPSTSDTDDFERAVQAFMINYVFSGEDDISDDSNGTTGILPFNSGVTGKVFIGPICPVQKDPPDPNCADKGYTTTVQVIEKNSSKSSLFSIVETDKEGNYKVLLPPGEYQLQAVGGQPFPRCEWKDIIIESDSMIEVDLSCDTGIR